MKAANSVVMRKNAKKNSVVTLVTVLALGLTTSLTVSPAMAQDAVNKPITDKWAVVVGISKFAKSDMNLRYPSKDARDFYNYLVTKGNFAPDHIKLITDEKATKARIVDVLGDSWLPRVALPEDLVVIFISSHGSGSDMDIRGSNFICAHDTNPDKLYTTGIDMKTITDIVRDRVHSERVLLVLDTCHSGAANSESKGLQRKSNADAEAIAAGTGQMVICSSSRDQVSWEGKTMQNSVFTRSLIDAFDAKGNTAPVSEVFENMKDKVEEQVVRERGVMQTPVMSSAKWSGNALILGAAPSKPRKAPRDLPSDDVYEIRDEPARANTNSGSQLATASVPHSGPVNLPAVVSPPATPARNIYAPPTPPPTPARTDNRPLSAAPSSSARQVSTASPIDFMRYHFRMVETKRYADAWDDLGSQYRAKFKNDPSAYEASVSRHRWIGYTASGEDFTVTPLGGTIKVKVRMNRLTGFNGYWLYTLSTKGGLYAIEDVGVTN